MRDLWGLASCQCRCFTFNRIVAVPSKEHCKRALFGGRWTPPNAPQSKWQTDFPKIFRKQINHHQRNHQFECCYPDLCEEKFATTTSAVNAFKVASVLPIFLEKKVNMLFMCVFCICADRIGWIWTWRWKKSCSEFLEGNKRLRRQRAIAARWARPQRWKIAFLEGTLNFYEPKLSSEEADTLLRQIEPSYESGLQEKGTPSTW